jgi:hypothetical protein
VTGPNELRVLANEFNAMAEELQRHEANRQHAEEEAMLGGEWKLLFKGQSVGHKRIERFDPVEVTKVRLRCLQSIAELLIRKLAVYHVEPPTTPLADAHWTFDEGAADAAAALHEVKRVAGIKGQALAFDGKRSYVSLGNVEVGGHDFTFAAWVRPNGENNASGGPADAYVTAIGVCHRNS